jgi:SnoaL-like domain
MPDRSVLLAAVRLGADYARLIDGRDAEGWSGLFTTEGCLDFGGRPIVGRPALLRFAAKSPAGVHVPGLPTITGTGHGNGAIVTCESPFVFVNAATGALIAGWYRDQLAWDGDELRFAHRLVDQRASSAAPG